MNAYNSLGEKKKPTKRSKRKRSSKHDSEYDDDDEDDDGDYADQADSSEGELSNHDDSIYEVEQILDSRTNKKVFDCKGCGFCWGG